MSQTKHTAGEWEASGTLVSTPTKSEKLEHLKNRTPYTSRRICVTDNEAYIPQDEADANARLIAASPNLLAACEAVLAWMTNVNVSDPATVGRQLMSAMEKAGYDKKTLDDAAVALVRGPCSIPNLCGEEKEEREGYCDACGQVVRG